MARIVHTSRDEMVLSKNIIEESCHLYPRQDLVTYTVHVKNGRFERHYVASISTYHAFELSILSDCSFLTHHMPRIQ